MGAERRPDDPGACWQVRRGAELVWKTWDDEEFLLYDASTGDTHLVNRVTREALRLLENAPRPASELVRGVAEACGVDAAPELEVSMANLLRYLDQVGLVEPGS